MGSAASGIWSSPDTETRKVRSRQQKRPDRLRDRGVAHFKSLAMTYSRVSKPTLPSALDVFTSEFGMGSGGSRPL